MHRVLRWSVAGLAGLAVALPLPAQETGSPVSLDAFLASVRAGHPLVRQAALARRQVDAEFLRARGAFDPFVVATWDTKRFKGIGYFDEFDARFIVPTRWGVDFKLGWERAAGQIINPERATPGEGLISAGISLPIGPRLLTDERRTARDQAEIAAGVADADLDAAVARVLEGAARDWGLWAEAARRAQIAADGVALAQFRFEAVRRRVETGDAAPIDTVEARAELVARLLQQVDADAASEGARLAAEAWLWGADGAQTRLPTDALPAPDAELDGEARLRASATALGELVARHPFVQQANARWRQADAQRRLAASQLLPSASVDLAGLAAGSDLGAVPPPRLGGDDSKFSGGLRIPLFVRQELGRLRAAEDRARALGLERERVRRDVEVNARRALVELDAVDAQLERQRLVVALQERLLEAEQSRFEAGESSLLIVNLRERSLLDERVRLAQLVGRRARALGAIAVAFGEGRR